MKRIALFFGLLLSLSFCAVAQAPLMFNYQAVIRDGSGQLVANQQVRVRISILQHTAMGSVVYSETHTPTTNANGLATLLVGAGTVVGGNMAGIDWGDGPYFLKSEVDPTGGTNYTLTTNQQLLSVPYALFSNGGDYTNLINKPDIPDIVSTYIEQHHLNDTIHTYHFDTVYNRTYDTTYTHSYDTLHTYHQDTVNTYHFDTVFNRTYDTTYTHSYDTLHAYHQDTVHTYHFDTTYTHNYDTLHTYHQDTVHTYHFDTVYNRTYDTTYTHSYDTLHAYHQDTVNIYHFDTVYNRTYDTTYTHSYDTVHTYHQDTVNTYHFDTVYNRTYDTTYTHSYDTLHAYHQDTVNSYHFDTVFNRTYDTTYTHSYDTVHTFHPSAVDTAYVDSAIAAYQETQGLPDVVDISNSAANHQIKDVEDPTEPMDAVNKRYLDSVLASVCHRYDSVLNAYQRRIDSLGAVVDSLTSCTSTYGIDTQTACESYMWMNGVTYTSSTTTPTFVTTNMAGCDSVVTLHLTINHGTHNVETQTASGSYSWHDSTYTASGSYTYSYTNSQGCPSADTLHLTITGGNNQNITVNGVTFNMVYVEGGTFTMGATSEQGSDAYDWEKPTHSVTLSSYYIGQTEVTQALWQAVMGSNPSQHQGDDFPVDQVSWNDVQSFITALNALTGKTFRLPTEAEWEYAARGGSRSQGYKYSGSNTLDNVAWYNDNSGYQTHAVATKAPNELGLYDMSGNVSEWCQDWYGSYSDSAQTNPLGPTSGGSRVHRGGGCYLSARSCRVSYRDCNSPGEYYFGFRLVLGINNSITDTACESYEWHGTTYTTSGTYTHSYTEGGQSCTDTLHLTINHGTHNVETQTASGSYSWHDSTYTASGSYTYSYTNSQGCPSTDTLHLTITGGNNQNITVNGVTFNMVYVSGGTFTMGATAEQGDDADRDESPTHRVTLSSYYIGETEVTQALWQAVMGSNPSYHPGDDFPVEKVSWNEVQTFITALNTLTGKNFRLPTEAEWEYAARGGSRSQGYKYSGSNTLDNVAWYSGNSGNYTHDVATKAPNELGLYDMSGNVYEWCQDWYGSYSSSAQTNPTGPSSGGVRVYRGGGCGDYARCCRVSYRNGNSPGGCGYYCGFRLVLGINNSITDTACESYEWHGTTYTTSGTYTHSYTEGGQSCTDTLHLTINHGTHNVETQTASGSYSWHDSTYTASGSYTYSYTNSQGCPSADTLHLTITGGNNQNITVNGVTFNMVYVEGGTFTMGATAEQGSDAESDESPTHRVTLSSYYIGETEVTQALWQAVMGSNPSSHQGGNFPVEQVSWNEVQTFITSLNALTGKTFRLPTEAEWEYAARGGSRSQGYKYSGSNTLDNVAWYNDNSGYQTHAVATKAPNELGLYDMSGNVYEWCQDWFGIYGSSAQTNPTGPSSGDIRVFRGGSYSSSAGFCRVSYRNYGSPGGRNGIGFRLVLAINNSITDTACESYEWHGTTYTTSGTYTHSYTEGGQNCTDTLHLTINHGTHNVETQTASGSYSWHDSTYTASGSYTYSYTNSQGCPSADTLHLTITGGNNQNITVNGVTFNMVYVEGGTFTMGATSEQGSDAESDESPTHRVTLSSYYIGETEVTQALWQAVMGSNPSYHQGDDFPVEYVSWNDVQSFITALNALTGKNFRLPTEAEWEYAARGGSRSQGYKYSGSNTLDNVAWYYDNSGVQTHAVGTKAPNELGLYDMSGNVWEWCQDWYGGYSSFAQTNPTGPSSGGGRVFRGGFCGNDASDCRVSTRNNVWPGHHNDGIGFRFVRGININNSITDTACESYEWYGTTYTTSGTYTHNYTEGGQNCTDTLHLTINHGTHNVETQTASGSYSWHGSTYTASGNYTYSYTNSQGCASTDTLHLTIPGGNNQNITVNGVTFNMVYVQGGTFTMGATAEQGSDAYDWEKPTHSVTLSSYYIGQTEVTQALWQAVMGSNPSNHQGGNFPVEQVSWNEVQTFITALNTLTGKTFRLPTEAEWEYAARGGSRSQGYKYSGINTIGDVAWYSGNSGEQTHDVATKAPNELGLYDMSGNVKEWCQDRYGRYSSSAQTNPTGPSSGGSRVYRGGSYFSGARLCRVSYRNGDSPGDRDNFGFRLVLGININNSITDTACESYEWHGSTYTTSGTYTHSYTEGGQSCTDTLHLTINHGTHNVVTQTASGSYSWHGSTYTASGNYTYSYTNSQGCPSADTLHLTITGGNNQNITVNGVTFNMVYVQGGTFTMGATAEQGSDYDADERPTHSVTLSSYYIGQTEVTQALWQAVMGSNPSYHQGGNFPVEKVSWNEVQTFITALNALTGKTFRLPTEAEWEYAARGGSRSQGYKYSGSNTLDNVAWYCDNSGRQTHAVGTKAPNELGLYDMSGNVYEWCQDWYGSYSDSAQTNPTGPSSGVYRVNRGGCHDYAWYCRVSHRNCYSPDIRYNYIGFRLVLGINNSITDTACESYEWHGTTYTTSGTYTHNYTEGGQSCTDTLHLTINHGTHNVVTQTASGSYSWHGSTYTASGSYTYNYTNSQGCPSADTLHLTITGGNNQNITVNGVTFNMVYVEGGTFTMGATAEQGDDASDSEKPTHSVTLSSYYIGQTEVTQALWQAVMGSNPSYHQGDDFPVEQVSWNEVQTFITALNALTGKTFRLPTEAEWEYAARGGSRSQGYKYCGSNTIGDVAWYSGNSGNQTHTVATKAPNELGLYDMSGNVWEWCQDWYGSYSSSAQTNPLGPTSGGDRVDRGGSYYNDARRCRVSSRSSLSPDNRSISIGFRLVLGINNSITDTACESYEWHGSTYTTSGTYTHSYTEGGQSCTDTLHLTINHGTHNVETQTASGSYSWHDSTYTASGSYTYSYTNSQGCASTDTLHLNITGGNNQNITVNGVTFNMVYVQGGTFTMGATAEQGSDAESNEFPPHRVTLSSYYIGQTEVTQALWQAVMGSNPSHHPGDDFPVEYVSWNDVQSFITALNALTGKTFRLPTEAEWEYAARGGSRSQGYKYSGSNTLDNVAWYNGNSGVQTHAVATKAPNELGLYDMSGNVSEWCQDRFGYYSSSAQTNPTGPSSGDNRVYRGGDYYVAWFCRVSCRDGDSPGGRYNHFGFRLVLVP